jgi:hypothetical protein
MTRARRTPKRTQAERDAIRTDRDIAEVLKARAMIEHWPASAWRDEVLALTNRELVMLRDPQHQAARFEAERCLSRGHPVPQWAMRALNEREPSEAM